MRAHQISIRTQRLRYVATDFVTTAIAFFIFDICRFFMMESPHTHALSLSSYLCSGKIIAEQILIPLALLGIYWVTGYYNRPFYKSRVEEFHQTFSASVINTVLIFFALLINDPLPARKISYELIAVLWASLFLFTYIGRLILTSATIRHFARREWCFNTVIVGDSEKALEMAKRLRNLQTTLGFRHIGHIPIPGESSSGEVHTVIDDKELDRLVNSHELDQIILVPENPADEQKVLGLLFRYFSTGVPVRIAPTSMSYLTSAIRLGDIIGEPFIDLTSPSMNEWQKNVKRVLDVALSSIAMLLLSPLYLVLAIAVKRSSPGPVIYRQQRIGYRQEPFDILKFRSMRTDAEADGPRLSADDDPRVTPVGRIMRKYRLDELPQFWNVLKGEMSLVGPRPEREYFIRRIVKEAPYYTLLHQVKPGVTSWGMVKYGYARSVEEMVERARYDLIYLSNMSVAVDFKILLHTIKTVVSGRGI